MKEALQTEIVLDPNLELVELTPTEPKQFNADLTKEGQKVVRDCIYGAHRHKNYLEYLKKCWASHYGVVISPDIVWYTILTELGIEIKNNAEKYRPLFTTSEGKTEIIVLTNDPQLISLEAIMAQLNQLVPTDTKLFVPDFSTTTKNSKFAFMAAFADAVTPYYNYSMMMCGISKVKIMGDEEDWLKITNNLLKLDELFPDLASYFSGIIDVVNNIVNSLITAEEDFIKNIFRLERCGSGGQEVVKGWISKLYIKEPRLAYVRNFSSSVAVVPYTFLDTGQKFDLCYGLFSSDVEDGYLVPDFGFIIKENV